MKINNLVEQIFAHAVALDQNGGMRNTIYCIGEEVYVMNYDHTVLLRFKMRPTEVKFNTPISFNANDYDSQEFEEKNGQIVFKSENQSFHRKKSCSIPGTTPKQVQELFEDYDESNSDHQEVVIGQNVLEMLDDNLSHVEFRGEKGGNLKILQRNIYSGSTIELEMKDEGGMFSEKLKADFGPIAMKTGDLQALFSFNEKQYEFSFPTKAASNYIRIDSVRKQKRDIVGIVACCLYDEVIELQEIKPKNPKK